MPATRPYPEPTPSSPHDPQQLPEDPLNIILPSMPWSPQMTSFPQASPPTPCANLYPPPYAAHALPISFVSILPPAQYWVRSTDQSAVPTQDTSVTARRLDLFVNEHFNSRCLCAHNHIQYRQRHVN